jgi:hypothetical protein
MTGDLFVVVLHTDGSGFRSRLHSHSRNFSRVTPKAYATGSCPI